MFFFPKCERRAFVFSNGFGPLVRPNRKWPEIKLFWFLVISYPFPLKNQRLTFDFPCKIFFLYSTDNNCFIFYNGQTLNISNIIHQFKYFSSLFHLQLLFKKKPFLSFHGNSLIRPFLSPQEQKFNSRTKTQKLLKYPRCYFLSKRRIGWHFKPKRKERNEARKATDFEADLWQCREIWWKVEGYHESKTKGWLERCSVDELGICCLCIYLSTNCLCVLCLDLHAYAIMVDSWDQNSFCVWVVVFNEWICLLFWIFLDWTSDSSFPGKFQHN